MRAVANSILLISGASLVVGMSSCSLLVDPRRESISIRSQGAGLVIAVCGDIEASSILVEERNLTEGRDWRTLSELQLASIEAGGVVPVLEGGAPVWGAADILRITITRPAPEGETIVAGGQFYLTDQGLPGRKWLFPDGSVSAERCPV